MVIVFWHQETGKLPKNLNLSYFIGFYTPILTHHHILLVIDSIGKAGLCATSPRQNIVQDVVSLS